MPGPESRVRLANKTGRIDMRYTYAGYNVQTGLDETFDLLCVEYKAPKWKESPRVWARAKIQRHRVYVMIQRHRA